MASSFLRFLDHTQRCITVGKTPLDEWSARHRDLYLTTHHTHNRQTSIAPVGFEPTTWAGERPQSYALNLAATGTGIYVPYCWQLKAFQWIQSSLSPFYILHTQVRHSGETLTNNVALMWVEVAQPWYISTVLKLKNLTFCPHTLLLFPCRYWSKNLLLKFVIFITEKQCVYCAVRIG